LDEEKHSKAQRENVDKILDNKSNENKIFFIDLRQFDEF